LIEMSCDDPIRLLLLLVGGILVQAWTLLSFRQGGGMIGRLLQQIGTWLDSDSIAGGSTRSHPGSGYSVSGRLNGESGQGVGAGPERVRWEQPGRGSRGNGYVSSRSMRAVLRAFPGSFVIR
jgi:hypothetical protein